MKEKNKDPNTINPLSAVDLVIDHSVQVDQSAKADSFDKNVEIEFNRNGERYSFLKWGQQAFNNFRIVPPGTGICHQVNLEYLSKVVWSEEFEGQNYLFPDTLVGTDSYRSLLMYLEKDNFVLQILHSILLWIGILNLPDDKFQFQGELF